MIKLYTANTANGQKAGIILEELGLEYEKTIMDLSTGAQKTADFLKINPNGKIPAIIDTDGPQGNEVAVFESGAILWYLAEKNNRFIPDDATRRVECLSWLMFEQGNVAPMFNQAFHFYTNAPEKIPYAIDRYMKEVNRLLDVLETRLGSEDFLAGEYSIADMANYTWVWAAFHRWASELPSYDCIQKWMETISKRPAIQRGVRVGKEQA